MSEEKQKTEEGRFFLASLEKIGEVKRNILLRYVSSAKELYELTDDEIRKMDGLSEKDREYIVVKRDREKIKTSIDNMRQKQIRMITLEQDEFPKRLRQIPGMPYALFVRGAIPTEETTSIAVVGARMCSGYGKAVAEELGEKLGINGINVISGMARGIDAFSQWGAIHGNGKTFAVLGCGVDVCYPPAAKALYEKIMVSGGILSEYPPGTPPLPQRFPARNRIISGLSEAVVVVEAKKKSGSLITADFALEQGKDVFAVPGRISDVLSEGCNELILQGAGVVCSVDRFLLELGILNEMTVENPVDMKKLLEKDELLVYSCLDLSVKGMDELLQVTNMPAEQLSDILGRLIYKNQIEETFKNYYRKIVRQKE